MDSFNETAVVEKKELPADGEIPPGVLIDEPSKFRNTGWTTEGVAINQIKHFTLIPDYHFQTESDRPVVAKDPVGSDHYFPLRKNKRHLSARRNDKC